MRASLTISRPQKGDGEERIMLQLRCCTSNTKIVVSEFLLEDFMKALTGLSEVEAETTTMYPNGGSDRVGKVFVVQDVAVRVTPNASNKERIERVQHNFRQWEREGWSLKDNGTNWPQETPGTHYYSICRYEKVEP